MAQMCKPGSNIFYLYILKSFKWCIFSVPQTMHTSSRSKNLYCTCCYPCQWPAAPWRQRHDGIAHSVGGGRDQVPGLVCGLCMALLHAAAKNGKNWILAQHPYLKITCQRLSSVGCNRGNRYIGNGGEKGWASYRATAAGMLARRNQTDQPYKIIRLLKLII